MTARPAHWPYSTPEQADYASCPGFHTLGTEIAYIVWQTIRDGENIATPGRAEVAGFLTGGDRYGEALEIAQRIREQEGCWAVVASVHACGHEDHFCSRLDYYVDALDGRTFVAPPVACDRCCARGRDLVLDALGRRLCEDCS